jgi:hypothetical protein
MKSRIIIKITEHCLITAYDYLLQSYGVNLYSFSQLPKNKLTVKSLPVLLYIIIDKATDNIGNDTYLECLL